MSSNELPTVGFVGLGEQGTPIAQRILSAGYPLSIWARRQAALAPFEGTSAVVASDLRDLASRCDIVCICVLDDHDVDDVVHGGLLAGLRPGSLIVVNSTTRPRTCRRLAAEAAENDVSLIDAPVTGMAQGAAEGTMAIFVGGGEDEFNRYAPIARTFGTPTHIGPLGTGQIVKLLNNTTAACNLVIAQDTLTIGAKLGIDRDVLSGALLTGSAGGRMLQRFAALGYDPVLQRDPAYFLRDWSRILTDLESVLADEHVDGLALQRLGTSFIERTSSYVSALS
jgi:3-hydroxyisobutyrate dehydrogenase